jgi:uncharacterized protein YbjT (DUF2867 family)
VNLKQFINIMSNSQFKTVTVAGGTGTLGYAIAEAFLNDGSYNVKILRRKPESENEKAKLLASKGAEIIYADYSQHDDLVKALKGTDVVVSALNFDPKGASFYDSQAPLLAAAKDASVKRFIPSEFGGKFKYVFFLFFLLLFLHVYGKVITIFFFF